jgi:hypothetical protein
MFSVTGGQQAQRSESKDILSQTPMTYDDSFVKNTLAVQVG